jgi:hypothetical protein
VAESSGFAPDSVHAEMTAEQREIADRVEADYNMQRGAELALAAERAGHTVRFATDDSLRRLGKLYRRELEDIDDGTLAKGRRPITAARLRDVEREQAFRAALAATWQAAEDGTHSYTGYASRGGLSAVLYHGARPPSYLLAVQLDRANWSAGEPHVLEWGETAEVAA